MNETEIKDILKIIIKRVENNSLTWRIEGSSNLKIQDVDVSVQDFDITTNDEGIKIFRNILKDFLVKDSYSEKIKGRSLICKINGFDVEINSYGDRKKDMFDKTQVVVWKNLEVPILPLRNALEFYELIGYKDKVDLISKYL